MLDAGEQAKLAELRVFLPARSHRSPASGGTKRSSHAHPAQARGPGAQRPGPARLQQPVRRSGHCRDDPGGHLARDVLPGSPRPLCRIALRLRLRGAEGARLLEDAASLRTTGAFALTEPEHGSDVAGGMETVARRVPGGAPDGGDTWVLNGAKRWIGNGTFCDYMLVWARDEADGGVRGFIVDATLPGVSRAGSRTRSHCARCRTPTSSSRTSGWPSLTASPGSTASRTPMNCCAARASWWPGGVGQQLAAFDVARQYAVERQQFGRPLRVLDPAASWSRCSAMPWRAWA